MIPFTPMNDNYERVVESSAEGEPEVGSPAAMGGVGASTPELGESGEALKQEGVLDETQAQQDQS